MYLEDVKWAHAHEELLRAFAANPNERRLRFNPMKPNQRAFIHSIAEDFGFDGESMDPEPHRHVMLFKTPKFVAAPMKTLQQAARIKRAALNVGTPVHHIASATVPVSDGTIAKLDQSKQQWNGVLLTQPRFALTESELQPYIIKAAPAMLFDIHFPSRGDQVVLMPSSSSTWEDPHQVAELLETVEVKLAAELKKHGLAKDVSLGVFETSAAAEPHLVHRKGGKESTSTKFNAGGWSQVAAKGSAPARAPQVQPVGQKPVYTVLGSRLAEAKRKKLENDERLRKQAEVVDDWEEEAEEEEKVKQAGEEISDTRSSVAISDRNKTDDAGDPHTAVSVET
jgi:transcriptional repressor NF-X1